MDLRSGPHDSESAGESREGVVTVQSRAAGGDGVRSRADPRLLALAFLLLTAAVLAPLALVEILMMVEYPNHLARIHVLASIEAPPRLQEIYSVAWGVIPNLAMDAVLPWLAQQVGLFAAGKLFIAMTMLMLAGGTLALHWALLGRVSYWPLVIFVFVYNTALALGFLNYIFGIGICLFLLAFWVKSENLPVAIRIALFSLGATMLFFVHPTALGAYGVSLGCFELARLSRHRALDLRVLGRRIFLSGSQFVIPAGLLLVFRPLSEGGGTEYLFLSKALLASQLPISFHNSRVDLVLLVALAVFAVLALRNGWVRLVPEARLSCLGLAICVVLVPTWLLGNWGSDFRLVLPLLGILIAGTAFTPAREMTGLAVAGIAVLLLAGRLVTVASDWRAFDSLQQEMRAAGRQLPPSARILSAVDDWDKAVRAAPTEHRRVFYNITALLLLERPVFLPNLFMAKGLQPLAVTPAFVEVDAPHHMPMPIDKLVRAVDPASAGALAEENETGETFHRFAGWPARFDYVMTLNFAGTGNPLPAILSPVYTGSYFTLYAIRQR